MFFGEKMIFQTAAFRTKTSVYRFSKEMSLVVPVTILAASFWISSSSYKSQLVRLSKLRSPYSNSGLIKDKYIVSKDLLSSVNFSDLMTYSIVSVTYLMCALHEQSLDMFISEACVLVLQLFAEFA